MELTAPLLGLDDDYLKELGPVDAGLMQLFKVPPQELRNHVVTIVTVDGPLVCRCDKEQIRARHAGDFLHQLCQTRLLNALLPGNGAHHRKGIGRREAAKILDMNPNTERRYRVAL